MPSEPTPKQQWNELVKSAKTVLILPHTDPDGDALGSALALKITLEKLGKEANVVTQGPIPETFTFLPQFANLQSNLNLQKDLLIIFDETQTKVSNISLKRVSDTKLMLIVTPKEGILTESDLHIEEGTFNADLIVTLDCAKIELLNPLAEENPNLFYEVPVVNIDHHPGNTNFGKVNIVDITASSVAEIMVSLIETIGKDIPNVIDQDVATCLLTGLITDTGSFQNGNTTPKSLTVAAQMVAAGGHQQEIITHVFKTRSLSTLRLWGRALSYIKEDQNFKFVWSVLSKADFVASQASNDEASGVIDELLKTAANMDFVLLLSERDGTLYGSLRSINPSVDVSLIANQFDGGGHAQAAAFRISNSTIATKEQEIINKIRSFLKPVQLINEPGVGALIVAPVEEKGTKVEDDQEPTIDSIEEM